MHETGCSSIKAFLNARSRFCSGRSTLDPPRPSAAKTAKTAKTALRGCHCDQQGQTTPSRYIARVSFWKSILAVGNVVAGSHKRKPMIIHRPRNGNSLVMHRNGGPHESLQNDDRQSLGLRLLASLLYM